MFKIGLNKQIICKLCDSIDKNMKNMHAKQSAYNMCKNIPTNLLHNKCKICKRNMYFFLYFSCQYAKYTRQHAKYAENAKIKNQNVNFFFPLCWWLRVDHCSEFAICRQQGLLRPPACARSAGGRPSSFCIKFHNLNGLTGRWLKYKSKSRWPIPLAASGTVATAGLPNPASICRVGNRQTCWFTPQHSD